MLRSSAGRSHDEPKLSSIGRPAARHQEAGLPEFAAPLPTQRLVVGLQRQIGNHAVSRLLGRARTPTVHVRERSRRPAIQRVRSVATFQGQTPGSLFSPRKTVTAIDTALGNYIDAPGPQKLAQATALLTAINLYLTTPDHDPARMQVVTGLQTEVQGEHTLHTALGAANGGLMDDLVNRAATKGGSLALLGVANTLGVPYVPLLPALVDSAPNAVGGLATLQAAITTIQPANSYLLPGLVVAAGGPANLAQLDTIIGHILPGNAWMLVRFLAVVPNLGHLDALIQASGVAHLGRVELMVVNAGGAAQVPALTAAINLNHAGHGDLGAALAARAAGNAARFTELTTILPHFHQAPPPALAPGGPIDVAILAYNANAATPAGGPHVQFNARIGQVSFDHFLERHTMEYFDFTGISPVNDLWPFQGAGAAGSVEQLVAQAITHIHANGVANWWIQPNVARLVQNLPHAGQNYDATIGVVAGGGTLPNPNNPLAQIPAVRLGQFFHVPPTGGVIPMNRDDMNAIHGLL